MGEVRRGMVVMVVMVRGLVAIHTAAALMRLAPSTARHTRTGWEPHHMIPCHGWRNSNGWDGWWIMGSASGCTAAGGWVEAKCGVGSARASLPVQDDVSRVGRKTCALEGGGLQVVGGCPLSAGACMPVCR